MTHSVIIFSNNDLDSLKRVAGFLANSSCLEVIWAVEGNETIHAFLESLDPKVNHIQYCRTRIGKSEAFNRALDLVTNDYVFLVSSDVEFDPGIFERVVTSMEEHNSGVALTRIKVKSVRTFSEKVGNLLWKFRDDELDCLNASGNTIHGGEFICIRKKFLSKIPDTINEDSLQCILAQSSGAKALYLREIAVNNFVPASFSDLVKQRRRVSYGYLELKSRGYRVNVLSSMAFSDIRIFLRIMKLHFAVNPADILLLPFLLFTEAVSNVLARHDFRLGRDHRLWGPVETFRTASNKSH